MRILVLGGTVFVGRHLVQSLLDRGHDVTLFHRGQRGAELFPVARRILGDRESDMGFLTGTWDAVVDTCGYVPRVVRRSAEHLKESCSRYLFVSTISVYSDLSKPLNEFSSLGELQDPTVETIDEKTYGPLKVACEAAVRDSFGHRATIVRPGLIIGPFDPSDRFTYWPVMLSQLPSVVIPDRPQPIQWIDVRDLANFMAGLLEQNIAGTFNAVGPQHAVSFPDMVHRVHKAIGSPAKVVAAGPGALEKAGVQPWVDLPFVLDYSGESDNMCRADSSAAQSLGLRFKSLEESAQDVLEWWKSVDRPLKVGMSNEKTIEVLSQIAATG